MPVKYNLFLTCGLKKNTWRNKKDKYNYKAKKKVMRRGGKNEAKKSRSREWQAL